MAAGPRVGGGGYRVVVCGCGCGWFCVCWGGGGIAAVCGGVIQGVANVCAARQELSGDFLLPLSLGMVHCVTRITLFWCVMVNHGILLQYRVHTGT
jgi:hypothetical protein